MKATLLGCGPSWGVPAIGPDWGRCDPADPRNHRRRCSLLVESRGATLLIDTSPDLRQQLIATPQLHPQAGELRHSPVSGVILTNGEIDAIAGLLSMREGSSFTVYAHPKVLSILNANSIFNVLNENVRRQPIELDKTFEPTLPDGSPSGIEILPFAVPGKSAWYLEGEARPSGNDQAGDTIGLRIRDKATGKYFYFLAACAAVNDDLKSRLAGAPLIFFDGTVWRDDELIAAGLGNKTGQGMGHIAMSGDHGAIESLAGLDIGRKIFLHINNSNPALLHDSAEREIAERAGWQIPADGTEIVL